MLCAYCLSAFDMSVYCVFLAILDLVLIIHLVGFSEDTTMTYSRLGSQVKVKCSVATSWKTGKLVLQLRFYLNLLFQNTWSYINWWLYILWHPRIDHSYVLLIAMQEVGYFELVYVMFNEITEPWCGTTYMIKVQENDNTRPIFISSGTI